VLNNQQSVDEHGDGKSFGVRADELLTAFVELESDLLGLAEARLTLALDSSNLIELGKLITHSRLIRTSSSLSPLLASTVRTFPTPGA
jgi:hypothetical protein